MFNDFTNGIWGGGQFATTPAVQVHVGFGYDPENYISTAKLVPSPYTTQPLIQARLGGLIRLTEACDDSQPPVGSLNPNEPPNNPAYATYLAVVQTVVTEINGYLSSVYPCPLAQTGTIAIFQITEVDSVGAVTAIQMIDVGNYCTAPDAANTPAYLRHIDPLANARYFGENWQQCQLGTGLTLTVTYADVNYSDESGQVLQAKAVDGTPVILTAGTGYKVDELLVLTGGSSFVPAKVRQATLDLICHSLYQRRLAPEEKNLFAAPAKMWREFFIEIGEGTKQLDGTYKRFFSAVSSWNTRSVLFDAGSL